MKYALLFALFFILATQTKAQTSVYHPFPDSGIIWHESFSGLGGNCCCHAVDYNGVCVTQGGYDYILTTDTLIGNQVYKKIIKSGSTWDHMEGNFDCPNGCNNYTWTYYSNIYVGGIRQDIIQRKIFFIPENYSQEALLYDFNLNVGDTIPQTYNNHYPSNYVSSVDSVLIFPNYHKRFNLLPSGASVIEGIGSTYGLLEQMVLPFEFSNELSCVTVDSITVYPDTASACLLSTTINEIKSKKESLSISPNPAIDHLTIHTLPNSNGVFTVSIISLLGEVMQKEKVEWITEMTIDIKNFSPGIYFLQMKSESANAVKKFIKE